MFFFDKHFLTFVTGDDLKKFKQYASGTATSGDVEFHLGAKLHSVNESSVSATGKYSLIFKYKSNMIDKTSLQQR